MGLTAATDQDVGTGCGAFHVVAEVVAEFVGTYLLDSGRRTALVRSGAEGIRTPDLRRATAALFLLSYSPKAILLREV